MGGKPARATFDRESYVQALEQAQALKGARILAKAEAMHHAVSSL